MYTLKIIYVAKDFIFGLIFTAYPVNNYSLSNSPLNIAVKAYKIRHVSANKRDYLIAYISCKCTQENSFSESC